MKTLLIPLAVILLTSCSKLEELTPPEPRKDVQVHVYIHKSICTLEINGQWHYLGDGVKQEVWTTTVKDIKSLWFHSPSKGCSITIIDGIYRTEYGFIEFLKKGG